MDDEDLQDPLECLFGPATEYEAKCLYEATKVWKTLEWLNRAQMRTAVANVKLVSEFLRRRMRRMKKSQQNRM